VRRAWLELLAVVLTGAGHLVVDSVLHAKALYVACAVLGWATYVAYRLREPGQARAWGLRRDNFGPALAGNAAFVLVAGGAMVLWGVTHGRGVRSASAASFWLLLALYPAWGVVQQLIMCSVVFQNLKALTGNRTVATAVTAAAFSLVHVPAWSLSALTAAAIVAWILLFLRWPNLWAQGLSHGVLATIAYAFVLGRDPWAELVASLRMT
jgi:hypothetical protein